ncbi:MAG TPA: protein kinase [Kofleriaceae bacterium]
MTTSSERVGRYQLLEPIGVGPCGTVSRAKVFGVAGFERQFAIKRFHPELTITSALASSLSSAARAYGSLEHPRIARMSEFGVAQGTTFTAVELVTGLDAARLVAESRLAGVTLAAGGALALVSQAARAVGYAHGRGLSHLGLSPTNVIVTSDGDIKITDFGILAAGLPARPIDVARLQYRVQYLAPEQLTNEATSAATDVFALGVIAYELVTGQRTFSGNTPADIARAITDGPPPEPPLPRPIVRVLHRCLARSPFERFPDARALADALDAALRVAPVPGTRKDIGAQVKATMDRLAEMRENEMSGMVALHVGTGPIPRIAPSTIPPPSGLGAAQEAETESFVRPDVPVPGPTPLTGPATDARAGLAPPIPVPGGIPAATMIGMAAPKVPTSIPPIKKLGTSQPIPTIPTIQAKSPTSPPPLVARTKSDRGIPPIPPRGVSQPLPPMGGAGLVPIDDDEVDLPAPVSRTKTPRRPFVEPPELQRPSEPAVPSRDSADHFDRRPAGRLEINPPTPFDPPTSPAIDALFGDDQPTGIRPGMSEETQLSATTMPGIGSPGAPAVTTTAQAAGRVVARGGSETPTSEMPRDFVQALREEAGRTDAERAERSSLSVQMEVVHPPEDLGMGAPGESTNAFQNALREVSAEQRALGPVPSSSTSQQVPPVRISTAPIASDVPSLAANRAQSASVPPPAAQTMPVRPQKGGGNKALIGLLVLVGVGGIGFGGWKLYSTLVAKDAGIVATAKDAGPKVATTTADAATTTQTADAAVAMTSTDAAAATMTTDAAVAATTVDAAADAAVAMATVDAPAPADAAVAATVDAGTPVATNPPPTSTPSDQLIVTSQPAGARVYIDGSDVGVTPVKTAGSTDRHTVALLLAGHELYIADIDGKGSFSIPLKEITPPGGGAGVKVIKCKAKERYYVFADGKPTGMMCPTERIVTGKGAHTIEVYDAVTETKNKWDVNITDDRLSYRIKLE